MACVRERAVPLYRFWRSQALEARPAVDPALGIGA